MAPSPVAVLLPDLASTDPAPPVGAVIRDPRTRILDVAADLFHAYGVRQVDMDQLRDAARVSSTRLRREFPSKEQLLVVCLRRQSRQWLEAARAATAGTAPGTLRITALVEWLAARTAEPGYRGCPFAKIAGELGDEYLAVSTIAGEHKAAWRDLLTEHAATVTGPDRPEAAGELADRLHLLTEGLVAATALTPDDGLAATARLTAVALAEQYSARPLVRDSDPPEREPERRGIGWLRRLVGSRLVGSAQA